MCVCVCHIDSGGVEMRESSRERELVGFSFRFVSGVLVGLVWEIFHFGSFVQRKQFKRERAFEREKKEAKRPKGKIRKE